MYNKEKSFIDCCSHSISVRFVFQNKKNKDDLFSCDVEEYYVSNNGKNVNDCLSISSPCLTVTGIIKKVPVSTSLVKIAVVGNILDSLIDSSGLKLHIHGCNDKRNENSIRNDGIELAECFFNISNSELIIYDVTLLVGKSPYEKCFCLISSGKIFARDCIVKTYDIIYPFVESGEIYISPSFIYANGGKVMVQECFFQFLNLSHSIFYLNSIDSSCILSIFSCKFEDITSFSDLGTIVSFNNNCNTLVVGDSNFKNINTYSKLKGSLLMINQNSSNINISGCSFDNINTSCSNSRGGVLYIENSSVINISDIVINNVSGVEYGGGIYIEKSMNINCFNLTFKNIIIVKCGGGIFFGANSCFNISSSYFGNLSSLGKNDGYGGGVFSNSSAIGCRYFINVNFENNSVLTNIGNDVCDNSTKVLKENYYTFSTVSECSSSSSPFKFYLLRLNISLDCFFEEGYSLDDIKVSNRDGMDIEICGEIVSCNSFLYGLNIIKQNGTINIVDSETYDIKEFKLISNCLIVSGFGHYPKLNVLYKKQHWLYISSSNVSVSHLEIIDNNIAFRSNLFYVHSGNIIVQSVKFYISNSSYYYFHLNGYKNSPLVFDNVTINNSSISRSVVYAYFNNNVTLNSCSFHNISSSISSGNSGGILYDRRYSYGYFELLISNCVVENINISNLNSLVIFCGVGALSSFTIKNSSFRNICSELSSQSVYMIYITREVSQIQLFNSSFLFMSGSNKGGVIYLSCYSVPTSLTSHIVDSCLFKSNRAVDYGGVFYIQDVNMYFSNCSFINNSVASCGYNSDNCERGNDIYVDSRNTEFYSKSTFLVFFFFKFIYFFIFIYFNN
jgi:hypothetical protein